LAATARPLEIPGHPADVGFRVYGGTVEELFANAELALICIAGDIDAVEEHEQREIEPTGGDNESLLNAWLAEIVAIVDAEHMTLRRVAMTSLREARIAGIA
jgi:SHS2 domain-containing protein